MPHGVIDSETSLWGSAYYTYQGNLSQEASNRWKSGLTQKPASRHNPKISGYRAPSNWYTVVFRTQISDGRIIWYYPPSNETWSASGKLTSWGSTESVAITKLDPSLADDVLRKVLSQMLEDDVAFNAFLLQGKQSLKMVANLATGLAHGVDNLMTAEFKKPKSFKKFLANAGDEAVSKFSGKYLEYLYGWKPLADDVENAFQAMLDGYTGPDQKRFRLSVRKSKQQKHTVTIECRASAYWTSEWWWAQDLLKVNRAKVVLHYSFPSQAGEMLPTMTPFGTAWELAPWSFVVDWFVPVGDWIGAMEATQYAMYMDNAVLTQSVKVTSNGSSSRWTATNTSGCEMRAMSPPVWGGQTFIMTREVLSRVAVLDRIRFPDFSSKFGLPQASQALALLSQVFKKWF